MARSLRRGTRICGGSSLLCVPTAADAGRTATTERLVAFVREAAAFYDLELQPIVAVGEMDLAIVAADLLLAEGRDVGLAILFSPRHAVIATRDLSVAAVLVTGCTADLPGQRRLARECAAELEAAGATVAFAVIDADAATRVDAQIAQAHRWLLQIFGEMTDA